MEAFGDESGIMIDGHKYKIEIFSPDHDTNQMAKHVNITNGKGFKIDNPHVGSWRVKIGDIEQKVHVTGKNNVTFAYGFTVNELNLETNSQIEQLDGMFVVDLVCFFL